jgi:hypothetical protein
VALRSQAPEDDRDELPPKSEPMSYMLALRTAGMVRPEIVEAVGKYMETGALRAMFTGEVSSPFTPTKEWPLSAYSIRTASPERSVQRALPRSSGATGVARVARQPCALRTAPNRPSPLTMFTARAFRIVAVKR